MKSCQNCNHTISKEDKHCSQCGQKIALSSLSFKLIITDFLSNFFNVESKIWKTLLHIWIPARLTKAFIGGQRASYYNPLRLFIIALFTCFTLLALRFTSTLSKLDKISGEQKARIWKKGLEARFDTISAENALNPAQALLIKQELFTYELDDTLELDFLIETKSLDSTTTPKDTAFHIESSDLKLDSLSTLFQEMSNTISSNSEFNAEDLLSLSEEQFKAKHQNGSELENAALLQTYKLLNNPSTSLSFLIGNGTWAILMMVLLMALLGKILYIRRAYFYTEHFLFHLYGHTRILVASIVILLIQHIYDFGILAIIAILFVGLVYLFLGMKNFYQQSLLKALFKYLVTLGFYSIGLIFCSILILGISFLVF